MCFDGYDIHIRDSPTYMQLKTKNEIRMILELKRSLKLNIHKQLNIMQNSICFNTTNFSTKVPKSFVGKLFTSKNALLLI